MAGLKLVNVPRKILDEVSGDEMWKHIEWFSKVNRVGGTPGDREGFQYICDTLTSYGIKPETYEFESYISIPLGAELKVTAPVEKKIHAITHAFAVPTPPEGVEAELVYVKPPEHSENPLLAAVTREDYGESNLKGKIVLVDGTASPTKVAAAESSGALGEIHISPEPMPHEMIVTTIWGTPTLESAKRIPRIHVASVGKQDGDFLKGLCSKGPVRLRLKTQVSTEWRKISIPVATIQGTREQEKFVLVGGHYCSWYVGVTDNATGDTSLLEIARLAHKYRKHLRRSVKVAWWPGHSQGRYSGSTWFADNQFDDLNKNAIAYVNIDSPGSKGASMYDLEAMPEAMDYAAGIASSVTKLKIQKLRPGRWGDQSFWGLGFPSIDCYSMADPDKRTMGVGGSGGGWWWHTPEDTLEKADREYQVRDTRTNLAMVIGLCNAEVLPYDFTKLAEQYIISLMELSSESQGTLDLKPLISKAKILKAKATRLKNASKPSKAKRRAIRVKRLNELQMKLSRVLVPVLFTQAGRYEQDPAADAPFFPALHAAKSTMLD
jgi:N-acetylated-alpha-linked acidic dipeptidase